MSKIVGHISQVIGPVVDVYFKFEEGQDVEHALPKIHDAMTIARNDGRTLVIEVQRQGHDFFFAVHPLIKDVQQFHDTVLQCFHFTKNEGVNLRCCDKTLRVWSTTDRTISPSPK